MCVTVFSFGTSEKFPFVLMHNRDEFFDRPSSPFKRWENPPGLFGGEDLKSGGMWLGFSMGMRFAMVTNFRDPKSHDPTRLSRGKLVKDFLASKVSPVSYLNDLVKESAKFNAFNLVVGVLPDRFAYLNSVDNRVQPIFPGLYGLSNGRLNSTWFKVQRGKALFESASKNVSDGEILVEKLMVALRDEQDSPPSDLPDTGLSADQERLLSPIFLKSGRLVFQERGYGTVSSTSAVVSVSGEAVVMEQIHTQERSEFPMEYRFTVAKTPGT